MKYNIFIALAGLTAIALGALMLSSVWQDAKSPHVELNKSDWHCSKTENYTQNALIGKAIVPQVHQRCVEYQRIE